jgi:NADH dehydrogenase
MSRILITGGTGAIGKKLVHRLLAQGHAVRVLTLPRDPQADAVHALGAEIIYGDVRDPATLPPACQGTDTVYHMAAIILSPGAPERFAEINVQGTRHLTLAAAAMGMGHFIHVSSASVTYPRSNPYALSKQRAEEIVRNAGLAWTIARPTLVYYDGGAQEFTHFVDYLRRWPVVPFIGSGAARKNPVYVDDLADALAAMAGNPAACGKTYNLSGGAGLTMRAMAELLLAHMGRSKPIVPLPVSVCRALTVAARMVASATGRGPLLTWQTISGIIQDADLDHTAAQRDLGYVPRPFHQGITALTGLKNCLRGTMAIQ